MRSAARRAECILDSATCRVAVASGALAAPVGSDRPARTIHIGASFFSNRWCRYYTLASKLSYLVTALTEGEIPEGNTLQLTEALRAVSPEFAQLHTLVATQINAKLCLLPGSRGGFQGGCPIGPLLDLFERPEALRQFLFHTESYVEVGNIREFRPCNIPTDRGAETQYRAWHAQRADPEQVLSLRLSLNTKNLPEQLQLPDGTQLRPHEPPAQQLCRQATVCALRWCAASDPLPWELAPDMTSCALRALTQFGTGLHFEASLGVLTQRLDSAPENLNFLALQISVPWGLPSRYPSLRSGLSR